MSSPETPHTPETPQDPEQPTPAASEQPTEADSQESTAAASPPPPLSPPGPPPARKLTRASSDKLLGGVAGGLGRYFSIDPIIFRIGFVVAAFVGGAGVLAYLAAWLLVPSDEPSEQPRSQVNRLLTITGGAVLAVAALASLGPGLVFAGPPLLALAVVGLIGLLIWRAASGENGDASLAARRIGLTLLVLAVSAIGFVAVAVGAAAGGGAIIAGLVIATGVALVAGAFMGGARWLVVPALVLAIPLGLWAASGIDTEGGIGERNYRPATTAELSDGYKLGMGRLALDLRDLDLPAGRTDLRLDLGIGSIEVLVPEDVCVASEAAVGAGFVRVLDRDSGGLDVDFRSSPVERGGVKRLVIGGDVGIGALQVVHDPSQLDDDYDRDGGPFNNRSAFNGFGTERNTACTEAA